MASPNATFTDMVTTTFRNHKKEVVDNLSNNNALTRWLKDKGKIRSESGGYEIVLPLDYGTNGTYKRISGYESFDVSASDALTAAKYDWKQAVITVSASGRELRMNSGPEAMIKLAKARTMNAMRNAANYMAVDLYSDGALTNQMGGLAAQITQNGQGTLGGINSATYTWWRNQFVDMTSPSASNIIGYMNQLWLLTVRGNDKPDLIVSSHDLYNYYESALQPLQRYMDDKKAAAGFESLRYKSAPVIFDDNTNFTTTTEDMYFLNTDYIYLIEHKDARWNEADDRVPVNQDAVVTPLIWMGELCCSNRARQGLLFDT